MQDQKKIQDQIKAEQEVLYGSKPSPSKPQNTKKTPRNSMGGANRRLSLGGATMQAPKTDILHSKAARTAKKTEDLGTLSPSKLHYPFIYYNAASFFLQLSHNSEATKNFQVVEAWTLLVFPSRSYLSKKHLASLLPRSCQETMSHRRRLHGQS